MKMTTVATVNVSADRSWQVIVEEFGDSANWVSSHSSSRLDRDQVEVGATRIAQSGKRESKERVTHIDRDAGTFAYELVDPPGPILAATNMWTIADAGAGQSTITSDLDLSLHWATKPLTPLLKFGLDKQLAKAIEEFRIYAEAGA